MSNSTSRRSFMQAVGLGPAALGMSDTALAQQKQKPIPGFEEAPTDPDASKGWKPRATARLG